MGVFVPVFVLLFACERVYAFLPECFCEDSLVRCNQGSWVEGVVAILKKEMCWALIMSV